MNKVFKKATLLTAGLVLSLSLFTGIGTTASAATPPDEETISPQHDNIGWRFTTFGGKLYKRQYNYSAGEWIGPWIPVG